MDDTILLEGRHLIWRTKFFVLNVLILGSKFKNTLFGDPIMADSLYV